MSVYVHRQPLPPAQLSVFVFRDDAPTNGAPDGNEPGLGGFEIVLEDAGGRYGQNGGRILTDKDGNLLKNAKAGQPDCPVPTSTPGVIVTCPDGTALIQNLPPAKYGVLAVPPQGATEGWVQTSTIEGTQGHRRLGQAERAGLLPGVRAPRPPRLRRLREPVDAW